MLCMILAPTYQQYRVYAHKDPRLTRYIHGEDAWRGMPRDVPFCVVGAPDRRVDEIRQQMLSHGYVERLCPRSHFCTTSQLLAQEV